MNLINRAFGKARGLLNTRKRVVLLLICILVTGFVIYPIFGKQKEDTYQTAQVEKGTLVSTVSASGAVSEGNGSNIITSATGVINTVYVKNGDQVSAGDKIVDITLDQSSQQKQASAWATYLQAKSSLNSAQAKINSLQSALFKANQTFVNDAGTANPDTSDPKYIEERADWLQAEADYKNQQDVIAQAQASLNSAWLSYQLISSTITAPSAGVVSNLSIAPGMAISSQLSGSSNNTTSTSNNTQSIGTITTDLPQSQAVVNLSEIDAANVRTGQKATLTLDAFPGKSFTGKVVSINTNGVVSSGVTTYPATIAFDTTAGNIYPNMSVTANIITEIKNNVLLVPLSAVQTSNGQSAVRVLINGQVQQVNVEAGNSNNTQTEIVSGLTEGQTVVTSILQGSGGSSAFGGNGFGGRTGGIGGGGVMIRRGQ